jgi:hypothetical protein
MQRTYMYMYTYMCIYNVRGHLHVPRYRKLFNMIYMYIILRKSVIFSARSLRTKPSSDTRECLAPIGRRPISAAVATVSFKLVRSRISIGWLCLFNAGPQKSYNSSLFSAMVFLPLYIDTNHNDVGSDAHGQFMPTAI